MTVEWIFFPSCPSLVCVGVFQTTFSESYKTPDATRYLSKTYRTFETCDIEDPRISIRGVRCSHHRWVQSERPFFFVVGYEPQQSFHGPLRAWKYEYCKPVCCCLQGITLFGAARRRNFPNFVVLKNVPHRNSIELAAASIVRDFSFELTEARVPSVGSHLILERIYPLWEIGQW